MSLEVELRTRLRFVRLAGRTHLYWERGIYTLCLRKKVGVKPVFWGPVECEGCLAKVGEYAMKEAWPTRKVA